MKTLKVNLLIILAILFSPVSLMASGAEVTWTDPEDFRDIDEGQGNKKRFQEKVLKTIEEHFKTLAAKLPENQSLKVKITDIDLAGDVKFGTQGKLRVVRDLYFPKMKFSYQLIGADNNIVSEDNVELKNLNFLHSDATLKRKKDEFKYEKAMISEWFTKTLIKS